ncbi:MAG: hypothetical protein KF780_03455 [Sphingomonas sp.]|nr:hypothetical protein [Sphingomonas sp.]
MASQIGPVVPEPKRRRHNEGNPRRSAALSAEEGAGMGPVLFVMAILGCGESDARCRELRVGETRYHSEQACLAAAEAALLANSDLPYPNIVADCRREGAQGRPLRGSDLLRPEPGRLPDRASRYAGGTPLRSSR